MGSVVVARGLSCSVACGIFPDQGLNPCPCIGRQILIHCAPREAHPDSFLWYLFSAKLFYLFLVYSCLPSLHSGLCSNVASTERPSTTTQAKYCPSPIVFYFITQLYYYYFIEPVITCCVCTHTHLFIFPTRL